MKVLEGLWNILQERIKQRYEYIYKKKMLRNRHLYTYALYKIFRHFINTVKMSHYIGQKFYNV